jgi:hypothetical protein
MILIIIIMLKDIANPGDRKLIQKEAEKIFKYTELTVGVQRM